VPVDVGEPQRARLMDELAKQPPPGGRRADPPTRRLVEADGHEALQSRAGGVEDAERCVPRTGERPRRMEHALEHRLEVELRQDRPGHLQNGRRGVDDRLRGKSHGGLDAMLSRPSRTGHRSTLGGAPGQSRPHASTTAMSSTERKPTG